MSSIRTQACKLVALTSCPRPSARSSQTFCELITPPCFISWPSLRSGSSIQFPSGHVLYFPHECDGVYPSRHLNAPHQVGFFFWEGKKHDSTSSQSPQTWQNENLESCPALVKAAHFPHSVSVIYACNHSKIICWALTHDRAWVPCLSSALQT